MQYSISQVAKASGVSARMLRHYDAIGLLTPASVAPNGYRWYGRFELLRLQRILLLRRLGLGLAEIGAVLGEHVDEATALRGHLAQLEEERRRLDRVIGTVEETLGDLGRARIEDPERFFAGLRKDGAALRRHYRETFGEGAAVAFDTAQAAQEGLTAADYEHAAARSAALFRRLAAVMRSGAAPDDPAALDAVAEHHRSVSHFWQPTAAAYAAMGGLYVTDPRQRTLAERADPALPAWLARAIEAYARVRLVPPLGKA
ncbi:MULTISPECIES: MerR family transcriptional regulator [unclassified Amycolatopsis]|uniref:MerR family transcriptional regulator n=1 Tax=unclassified Amycolatopsis TaxID=2618356 RepID=UPI0028770006|nr:MULTISPECIES: MerR family transcriptional regulator [unclassified Amycolatopsis]MDS0136990.1 MerR family transcriptional regulator [Amycolatopsis sp. 505]MDS0143655.1 MerR family transcriptional regulator [Amycolatopsis sp. CM201R]